MSGIFGSGSGMMVVAGLALTFACGGAQKPPDAPAEDPPAEEILAPDPTREPSSEATVEEESAGEESESGGGVTASAEDFREALQVVIQDDALLSQLNLEEPGRFPVKITGQDIPTGIEVQALTQNVEIVEPPKDPAKEAVLVFTKIDLSAREGTFKYKYGIEGVRGTSHVAKTEGRWVLRSSRITKY